MMDLQQLTRQLVAQKNDTGFRTLTQELQWRGLIHVSTDIQELEKKLETGPLTYYCGFDPTAPSLHLGNLVQLLTMRRLQLAGHQPLGLIGGSTGLIGDPRPTSERVLNSRETVAAWSKRLEEQIRRFLNFDGDKEHNQKNAVRIVNNLEWTDPISAIDFLRDIGKYFRVGTMIKKDAVSARLNSDAGISYTEFSYQVLQAMDYLQLYRNYGCVLQTGGSDQWGNLVGGVELVHKSDGASVHALGTPLITNSDGTKFGKSEGNAVWLDASMVTVYAMYQFWINTTDADVIDRLKVFSFLNRQTIEAIADQLEQHPHERLAQKILAFQATATVHGEESVRDAMKASVALFGGGDISAVDEQTLETVLAHLERVELERSELESGNMLLRAVMARSSLAATMSEARRTIRDGGVYINGVKVEDEDRALTMEDLMTDSFISIRRGKKKQIAVKVG